MYRCCSIEPTVPVCVFLCVLPLFRIYQSTATCFTHSALVLLSSLYYSSVVLLWFCVLFSHSYENSNKTGLSFTFCRTQHTCRQPCTYLQTAVCRKVEVFNAYGTTKTRSALSLCVCEWIWQSANTSLTHFSIYKIDAALLCPLNSSHFSLPVPWHTHTERPTSAPTYPFACIHPLFAINLPQGRGTSTVFVLQSNLIGVKEEADVLRAQTRAHIHTHEIIAC